MDDSNHPESSRKKVKGKRRIPEKGEGEMNDSVKEEEEEEREPPKNCEVEDLTKELSKQKLSESDKIELVKDAEEMAKDYDENRATAPVPEIPSDINPRKFLPIDPVQMNEIMVENHQRVCQITVDMPVMGGIPISAPPLFALITGRSGTAYLDSADLLSKYLSIFLALYQSPDNTVTRKEKYLDDLRKKMEDPSIESEKKDEYETIFSGITCVTEDCSNESTKRLTEEMVFSEDDRSADEWWKTRLSGIKSVKKNSAFEDQTACKEDVMEEYQKYVELVDDRAKAFMEEKGDVTEENRYDYARGFETWTFLLLYHHEISIMRLLGEVEKEEPPTIPVDRIMDLVSRWEKVLDSVLSEEDEHVRMSRRKIHDMRKNSRSLENAREMLFHKLTGSPLDTERYAEEAEREARAEEELEGMVTEGMEEEKLNSIPVPDDVLPSVRAMASFREFFLYCDDDDDDENESEQ